MSIQSLKKKNTNDLKDRVYKCRETLAKLGVKKGLDEFCKKYPELIPKVNDIKAIQRLQNLWYGKLADTNFTIKLEAFVVFKEAELNQN